MSSVYEEFEREVAEWRRKYAGRPEQEIVRLLVLALEREEIVSVSYRQTLMSERLARMPIPDEARELIHHALVWVWKDEEMHAVYVRGAILRLGRRWLSAKALLRQLAGALGGWSAAARQHVAWRQAPFARLAATGVTWAGVLAGQVPREVRRYLAYRPFRDFCLFNVDAERTAALSFRRLEELWEEQRRKRGTGEESDDRALVEIRKMRHDEERHEQIFRLLADALGEDDRLAPGVTPASLVAAIAEVGESFLPRSLRRDGARHSPIGSGGPVWVAAGESSAEKLDRFAALLADAGLAECLATRAGELGKAVGDLTVVVKPSFMLGYHRKDLSVIVDPVLVAALAGFLREQGVAAVKVIEGPNLYDFFYQHRSVTEVAAYFGYAADGYELVDSGAEQVPHAYGRGMAQYTVARSWKEADFRISFGKLRSHPCEQALLAVGNLEGLAGRSDEYIFVERQAHRDSALAMLIDDFPPHFALLEGYDFAADGLMGVIGCPRAPAPRRLYAGGDALAVDQVASRHLHVADPRDSPLLAAAYHWFGVEPEAVEVRGPDTPIPGWRSPRHNDWSTFLSFLAYPVYAYGSGRGALFVGEMDEEAFPPAAPVGWWLRMGRKGLQWFLGLRWGRT